MIMKTILTIFLSVVACGFIYGQEPTITNFGDLQVELVEGVATLETPQVVSRLVDADGNTLELSDGTNGIVQRDTIYTVPVFYYNLFVRDEKGGKIIISQIRRQ